MVRFSNRGYLRKKAVLVLYKAFLSYPEALRPAFPRLTEKIEDNDLAVVSAVVTVLCELCIHNPQNYLPMAPTFYKLLQVSYAARQEVYRARVESREQQRDAMRIEGLGLYRK